MVIVDARVIWVMWQVTPQSVVAAQTFQSFERVQRLHPLGAEAAVTPAAFGAAPSSVSPAAPEATAFAGADLASQEPAMLRMATEIKTPMSAPPEKLAPKLRAAHPHNKGTAAGSNRRRLNTFREDK